MLFVRTDSTTVPFDRWHAIARVHNDGGVTTACGLPLYHIVETTDYPATGARCSSRACFGQLERDERMFSLALS